MKDVEPSKKLRKGHHPWRYLKVEHLGIRLTFNEYDWIRGQAEKFHISISSFVRMTLLRDYKGKS